AAVATATRAIKQSQILLVTLILCRPPRLPSEATPSRALEQETASPFDRHQSGFAAMSRANFSSACETDIVRALCEFGSDQTITNA
ncbi:MAG: hypothetical protein WBX07_06540, partial [Rhodoplanes sp.]